MVKQLPVPGAIPFRADGPQMRQERCEHTKILEALECLLCHRGGGVAAMRVSVSSECVRSCISLLHARYALYPVQNSCRTLLGEGSISYMVAER